MVCTSSMPGLRRKPISSPSSNSRASRAGCSSMEPVWWCTHASPPRTASAAPAPQIPRPRAAPTATVAVFSSEGGHTMAHGVRRDRSRETTRAHALSDVGRLCGLAPHRLHGVHGGQRQRSAPGSWPRLRRHGHELRRANFRTRQDEGSQRRSHRRRKQHLLPALDPTGHA